MVMQEESPLQIQHIRKKFARDLAEREFYKSKEYKIMAGQEGKPGNRTMTGIHQAATYTLDDLSPYIQKCLIPLTPAEMLSKDAQKPIIVEDKLSRNEKGQLNSEVVEQGTDLHTRAAMRDRAIN